MALKGEPVVIIGSLNRHKYGRGLTVECLACGKTKRGLSGPEVAAFYDLHTNGHAPEELGPKVASAACDRCSQGVMDADGPAGAGNDHLYGRCQCECHRG